jgi:hypothetical protein
MEKENLIKQIVALLRRASQINGNTVAQEGSYVFAGTMSLFCSLYGEKSEQVALLKDMREKAAALIPKSLVSTMDRLMPGISGMLENLLSEVQSGLLGNLKNRFTGEVLSDFIGLAREALSEDTSEAKNVAAVLAAAAYEDTLRRIGSEFAQIHDRPELQMIISELKKRNILEGPQVGIASAYLKFRNDALHADWAKIDRASIESALGFVEQLLFKHFA